MQSYDEYQKHIRYKYGYYSFEIITFLTLFNYFLSALYDFQWAETKELEIIVIIFIANIYSLIMFSYRGAYLAKWQSPKRYSIIYFVFGIAIMTLSFFLSSPLVSNGRITSSILLFLIGLVLIRISCTYLVTRFVVDKLNSNDIGGR
ncbi:hypothetical protein SAMN04488102_11421 [Alkalibacterium subtropicum]|uniref:Uncharacterized protein n=1 Tax=Alkalibacterium subtropicum TaxID=753702 RepID=A0A1I1KWP2_9LACT|nr:hypothetical protein SAMN04488102_11421 [Alkalibacterium subtropicum]